ncbi:MAG: hypothetical protein ABIH04_06075 [Planctomycetota bacterium]
MKRITILALLAAMAAVALGCAATVKDGGQAAVPRSDFSVDGLLITLTIDKENYKRGEAVDAKAIFTNCSDEILRLPICETQDRNLFIDALLVGDQFGTIPIHKPGNGTCGTWTDHYGKKVILITLKPGESYTQDFPSLLPKTFYDEHLDTGWCIFDRRYKMYLVYRDCSFGHGRKRDAARYESGRYWEGACVSKPVTITFGLKDRPDNGE